MEITVHLFLLDCQIQQVWSMIDNWGWIAKSSPNQVNN